MSESGNLLGKFSVIIRRGCTTQKQPSPFSPLVINAAHLTNVKYYYVCLHQTVKLQFTKAFEYERICKQTFVKYSLRESLTKPCSIQIQNYYINVDNFVYLGNYMGSKVCDYDDTGKYLIIFLRFETFQSIIMYSC